MELNVIYRRIDAAYLNVAAFVDRLQIGATDNHFNKTKYYNHSNISITHDSFRIVTDMAINDNAEIVGIDYYEQVNGCHTLIDIVIKMAESNITYSKQEKRDGSTKKNN